MEVDLFEKIFKISSMVKRFKIQKKTFWRLDKMRLNNIIEEGGWHFCNLKKPSELSINIKISVRLMIQ